MRRSLAAILCCAALLLASAAGATETITAGAVGSPTSGMWPYLIAMNKGFLAEQGIALDIVYAPTAPGILQQLAAGSLDVVATTGLVEPIHAVEKGAPVAILRVIGQAPPYALLAKPAIKSVRDLKGKTVSIGGLVDITRIYFDRIAAANGLHQGDVDLVVIGATGARFAGLKSGAIDATLLVPPFSFHAEAAGFAAIALAYDYARDLPFTGLEVSRPWAERHGDAARRLRAAVDKAVAWFYDDANRQEAIDILAQASKIDGEEVAQSYDFLRKIAFFAPTSKVSGAQLRNLMQAMKALGDIEGSVTPEALVLQGLTDLTD